VLRQIKIICERKEGNPRDSVLNYVRDNVVDRHKENSLTVKQHLIRPRFFDFLSVLVSKQKLWQD
jgi:hypothetical protein